MSTIQTLVSELSTKLSFKARQDLQRLIETPAAQEILASDEEVILKRRRELIATIASLPAKFAKAKIEAVKPCQDAAERLAKAEDEVIAARANLDALRAAANVPQAQENRILFAAELELLETADSRLEEFSAHVSNAKQAIAFAICVWPCTERNWLTGNKETIYQSNAEEITQATDLLAEAIADIEKMRMSAVPFAAVSQRLTAWTNQIAPELEKYALPVPYIDASGRVKCELLLTHSGYVDQCIAKARGTGRRALT